MVTRLTPPPPPAPPAPAPPTALEAELLEIAGAVLDPELPVLTLRELGVVRAVHVQEAGGVEVELTPTYTGCPAIEAMSTDIEQALHARGYEEVAVRRVLAPAWSTDDITSEGRRKLREFGIAPPRVRTAGDPVEVRLGPTRGTEPERRGPASETAPGSREPASETASGSGESQAPHKPPEAFSGTAAWAPEPPVPCPHCGSEDTELLSRFSSTACKALRRCRVCREPFDHFKEL